MAKARERNRVRDDLLGALAAVRERWLRRRHALPPLRPSSVVADDRFQAWFAVHLWLAEAVHNLRVLDWWGLPESGAALRKAGAELLPRDGTRLDPPDLAVLVDPGEEADALEPALRDALELEPVRIALARGIWSRSPPDLRGSMEAAAEPLRERYLKVRRHALLLPGGYAPRFDRPLPARARAQEYRVEELGDDEPLPPEAVGWVLVADGPPPPREEGRRVHVGSGMEHLDGWVNVDLEPLPGVDLVLDVTRDFPFSALSAIYAEHFLEHLEIEGALAFLRRCHQALAEGGRLRLSTPNLLWVWSTHYRALGSSVPLEDGAGPEAALPALKLNRAFYGWGHRFLWDRPTLRLALEACGFGEIGWPAYGESRWPDLEGLERHERYADTGDLPHVLIVEAVKSEPSGADELENLVRRRFLEQREGWGNVLAPVSATPRARPDELG